MKKTTPSQPNPFTALSSRLLSGRKYRALHLPQETLDDLIHQASQQSSDMREVEHIVREKLHHLVAPYLGDPDYAAIQNELVEVYKSGDLEQKKAICRKILAAHASTKERQPILDEFYPRLFSVTGVPHTILDLACGLNPFSLPWMGLPADVQYYAYDLHQPRLDAINHFFALNHLPALAIHQDILVNPPSQKADVAFFFKEAHRFEQRHHGCNRAFWQSLNCRFLLVSLPTRNLTGSHPKLDQHRRLVMETLQGLPWQVSELLFDNEIVFCIEKINEA